MLTNGFLSLRLKQHITGLGRREGNQEPQNMIKEPRKKKKDKQEETKHICISVKDLLH